MFDHGGARPKTTPVAENKDKWWSPPPSVTRPPPGLPQRARPLEATAAIQPSTSVVTKAKTVTQVASRHRVSKVVRKSKSPDTDLDEANILKWGDQPTIHMPGDEDSPIPDAPPGNSEGEIVSEAESEEMDTTEAPSSKRSKPGNTSPPSRQVTVAWAGRWASLIGYLHCNINSSHTF